jgi:hypothetical protein
MTKLSISELRETQAYQNLSAKQQLMVETFLETGSKVKAVLAASSCKESSARTQSYFYFSRIDVRECLEVANGVDPKLARAAAERLQWNDDVNRLIGSKNTTRIQIAALRLKAVAQGYLMPEETAKADGRQKFAVGDIVVQDGKKFRIVAQEIS